MFGFLKRLRRGTEEAPSRIQGFGAPTAATAGHGAPIPGSVPGRQRRTDIAPTGARPNGNYQATKGLELPLQAIIQSLPAELQSKVKFTNVGDMTIPVPLDKILSQLPRGAVRVPFGELRMSAPQVFSLEETSDHVLVSLPLGEILPRLSPALITRRRTQKQVETPDDICSPFDQYGQGLIFSVGPSKTEAAAAPAPAKAPAPAPPQPRHVAPPSTPTPPSPARSSITFSPTPQPPAAAPIRAPAIVAATRALRELNANAPAAHAPAAPPAPPAKPQIEPEALTVSLSLLAEGWPEPVRKELVDQNLVDAKVALPVDLVGQALRQGRIVFSWKTLRSWIRPALLPSVSAHDNSILELPLKVLAPMFLTRRNEGAQARQKVAVASDIPNLFFGFPQPETPAPAPAPAPAHAPAVAPTATAPAAAVPPPASSHAVTRPVDTNIFTWDDADPVRVHESEFKRQTSPGTKFVAKYATPNEVVSRAAALDGIAGALIALPDGLMVASRLSADLNADTLAAFLPHIFGKVSQCTKELRMGELNNLNFTVGNVPWKIFRVNAIFFAAFGRIGEPLPTAQLAALALELDHKPK
jgi:predicted regulator of Ras-like GTPase activity (Roadblock/LC7/MglB family)